MYVTSSPTLWPVRMEYSSGPLIAPRSEEGADLLQGNKDMLVKCSFKEV